MKTNLRSPGNELYSLECVRTLYTELDLSHQCGYITLLCPSSQQTGSAGDRHSGTATSSTVCANHATDAATSTVLDAGQDEVDTSSAPSVPAQTADAVTSSEQHTAAAAGGHVLLDCTFGLPLFDAQLNERVCERIVEFGLCTEDAMRRLTQSSRKLALKLLEFIEQYHVSQCQAENVDLNGMVRFEWDDVAYHTIQLGTVV